MQAESFSKYQSWVEAGMECAKGVRRRKWLLESSATAFGDFIF